MVPVVANVAAKLLLLIVNASYVLFQHIDHLIADWTLFGMCRIAVTEKLLLRREF